MVNELTSDSCPSMEDLILACSMGTSCFLYFEESHCQYQLDPPYWRCNIHLSSGCLGFALKLSSVPICVTDQKMKLSSVHHIN